MATSLLRASLPLLLALSSPALAQDVAPVGSLYDLRAPAPAVVGQRTRRSVRTSQRGAVVIKIAGKPMDQQQDLDEGHELVVVEEALSIGADGRADRVLRVFEQARGDEASPDLAGVRVLVVRKADGTEALATPDGTPLDEKTRRLVERVEELERDQQVPTMDPALPEAPVALGATWDVPPAALDELMKAAGGSFGQSEVREARGTLEAVEVVDGVEVMRVALRVRLAVADMEAMTFDPPGELELVVRYETAGAASPVRLQSMSGTFSGSMSVEGQKDMQVTFDVRFEGEERIALVPPPTPEGE